MYFIITIFFFFFFPMQPQGFETGKFAAGREDQHQNRRFRYGVTAAQRQHAGNQLRFAALRVSRSHPRTYYQSIGKRDKN